VQVRRGINLVYGGGSIGLMGVIARTVRDGGCHVLGYLPRLQLHLFVFFARVTCTLFEYTLSDVLELVFLFAFDLFIRSQGDSQSAHAY